MIRKTKQREIIEAVLVEEGRPLTPQELFDFAKKRLASIGLRTIYRQIQSMSAEGLILGIDYPGQPLRYEWIQGDFHSHFICRGCQKVFDLPGEAQDVEMNAPKGFKITGQETIFYGYCPDCKSS